VRDVAPAELSVDVPGDATPAVTFARALDPASVSPRTVQLLGGVRGRAVPATVAYDPVRRRAVVTPLAPLRPGLPYAVQVRDVGDVGGASMAETHRWTFTVAP
jgi:hypothetical protein